MSAVQKPLTILLAASGALVAGCGGMTQTYEGPRKPAHDVAILKTNVGEQRSSRSLFRLATQNALRDAR